MAMTKEHLRDLFRNLTIIENESLSEDWLAQYNLTEDDVQTEKQKSNLICAKTNQHRYIKVQMLFADFIN